MHQIRFPLGFPPDPLAEFKGPILLRGGRGRERGREGEGKGREGREEKGGESYPPLAESGSASAPYTVAMCFRHCWWNISIVTAISS